MSPDNKEFARDWYDGKLTLEELAAKWNDTVSGIQFHAINRLDLGPRSRPALGWSGPRTVEKWEAKRREAYS